MQEPLHAPQEELLRPSRLLIEGIIGHIENSHGNATQNIGFRTKNVELNPGSWSCVVTLDEVSITVEYGQNAESKKWNISIGVSKGLDPLLALCAYGPGDLHFRDAQYSASGYTQGEWERALI